MTTAASRVRTQSIFPRAEITRYFRFNCALISTPHGHLIHNFTNVGTEGESLRKKCPYSELFWAGFSRIRTEYGEILRICPYLVRMEGKYGPK